MIKIIEDHFCGTFFYVDSDCRHTFLWIESTKMQADNHSQHFKKKSSTKMYDDSLVPKKKFPMNI
jgi:hypothetical protein